MHEVVRVVARDRCPRRRLRGTSYRADGSAGCADPGAGGDQATSRGGGIARGLTGRIAGRVAGSRGQAGRIAVTGRVTRGVAGRGRQAGRVTCGGAHDVEGHLSGQRRVPDELVARG